MTAPGSTKPPGERELDDIEAVFAALAHAARRQILLILHHRGGAMTAGEVASRFECSWPTTTRHLRVLEHAGLVTVEPSGRERRYVLQRDRLLGVTSEWLVWFRDPPARAVGRGRRR